MHIRSDIGSSELGDNKSFDDQGLGMPPQGLGEQRVPPFVAGDNTMPMMDSSNDQNSPPGVVTFLPPDEKRR
jgi:hypothetical protein